MAQQQLQITIPEPCHENWNAMTPREQGRFCSVCTKTVVDFSTMSDGQIIDLIKNNSGQKLCGHFYSDQLSRPLVQPAKPKWYLTGVWKYIVGVFLLIKSVPAKAQGDVKVEQCTPVRGQVKMIGKVAPLHLDNKEFELKGGVVDEKGNPVPYAQIQVKNTRSVVSADAEGKFKLMAIKGQTLVCSAIGFKTIELKIESSVSTKLVLAELAMDTVDGMMVIRHVDTKPVSLVYTIRNGIDQLPLKDVKITWFEPGGNGSSQIETSRNGTGRLNKLYRHKAYGVTISAPGFTEQTFELNGAALNAGINTQTVYLMPVPLIKPEPVIMGIIAIPERRPVKQPEPIEASPTLEQLALQAREAACKLAAAANETATSTAVPEVKQPVISNTIQLKVQPNPVVAGAAAVLRFVSANEEQMLLQVVSANGGILHHQKLQAIKGSNIISLQTKAAWPAGLVVVKLMNSKGQWVTAEQLVIVN